MTSLLGNFAFVDHITGDFIPADTAVLLDMSGLTPAESEDFGDSAEFRSDYARKFGVDAEELEYAAVMKDHRNFQMTDDEIKEILLLIYKHADNNNPVWKTVARIKDHFNPES